MSMSKMCRSFEFLMVAENSAVRLVGVNRSVGCIVLNCWSNGSIFRTAVYRLEFELYKAMSLAYAAIETFS